MSVYDNLESMKTIFTHFKTFCESKFENIDKFQSTITSCREWKSTSRKATVKILGCILFRLISLTDTISSNVNDITIFHSNTVPEINIIEYFERIAFYTDVSNEVLILSLIQIFRIRQSSQCRFKINSFTIHRLLLTCIMCYGKYQDDSYYNNFFFSKVGGINLKELNRLEVEFITLTKLDLYVSDEIYNFIYTCITSNEYHTNCTCNKLLFDVPTLIYEIQAASPGIPHTSLSTIEDGDPHEYPDSSSGYASLIYLDSEL